MKILLLLLTLSVASVCFLTPVAERPGIDHCTVRFDTSRGPSSFDLEARHIDGIMPGARVDRSQKPYWCVWFFCSYPRVESSWIVTHDMTSYHVQETVTVAEAKIQACKPNFRARQ